MSIYICSIFRHDLLLRDSNLGVNFSGLSQLDYIHMTWYDGTYSVESSSVVELDDSIKQSLKEKFLSTMWKDVLELVELVLANLHR